MTRWTMKYEDQTGGGKLHFHVFWSVAAACSSWCYENEAFGMNRPETNGVIFGHMLPRNPTHSGPTPHPPKLRHTNIGTESLRYAKAPFGIEDA